MGIKKHLDQGTCVTSRQLVRKRYRKKQNAFFRWLVILPTVKNAVRQSKAPFKKWRINDRSEGDSYLQDGISLFRKKLFNLVKSIKNGWIFLYNWSSKNKTSKNILSPNNEQNYITVCIQSGIVCTLVPCI